MMFPCALLRQKLDVAQIFSSNTPAFGPLLTMSQSATLQRSQSDLGSRYNSNRTLDTKASKRTTRAGLCDTPGGYQLTYTGVLRQSAQNQKRSVERLASIPANLVPENRRVVPSENKQRHGLTLSYQWTAGGKTVHGFMWWRTGIGTFAGNNVSPLSI